MEGFRHWSARQIMGMTATCGEIREWGYPLVVAALEATGLHSIMEYIRRRQATLAEKLAC